MNTERAAPSVVSSILSCAETSAILDELVERARREAGLRYAFECEQEVVGRPRSRNPHEWLASKVFCQVNSRT
jgi:hypothetical protein